MKISELKKYINSIPSEYDEFNVVKSELKFSNTEKNIYILSDEISTINIDLHTKELQIHHQTDEDVKKMLTNGITKGTK